MYVIWTAFRIKHWVKNTFVFLPAFFALRLELLKTPTLWLLFGSLCLAASAVYLFNDLMDLEADRQHPQKRHRPIASGQLPIEQAKKLLLVLLFVHLSTYPFLPNSWPYLLAYLLLNAAYSTYLKKWPIIDVCCIALGFLLRIFAGGQAVGIPISNWMILVVFLLTISIAFAKRRSDALQRPANHALLSVQTYGIATGLGFGFTFLAYLFYCLDATTIRRLGNPHIYLTATFVLMGILRYLQLIFIEKRTDDPTHIFWTDRSIQIVLFLWLFSFAFLVYE